MSETLKLKNQLLISSNIIWSGYQAQISKHRPGINDKSFESTLAVNIEWDIFNRIRVPRPPRLWPAFGLESRFVLFTLYLPSPSFGFLWIFYFTGLLVESFCSSLYWTRFWIIPNFGYSIPMSDSRRLISVIFSSSNVHSPAKRSILVRIEIMHYAFGTQICML